MLRPDPLEFTGIPLHDERWGDYIDFEDAPKGPEQAAFDQLSLALGGNWPEEQFEALRPENKHYFCALLTVIACTAVHSGGDSYETMSLDQIRGLHELMSDWQPGLAAATLQDLADYAVRIREDIQHKKGRPPVSGANFYELIKPTFDTRQINDGLPPIFRERLY